jgi:hypothetical protein
LLWWAVMEPGKAPWPIYSPVQWIMIMGPLLAAARMLHSAQTIASAFPFSVFRGSTPSATAFGPFACLSTLKDSGYPLPSKTNYRRLANLTGRDSHPLYDAAGLGRTAWHQKKNKSWQRPTLPRKPQYHRRWRA